MTTTLLAHEFRRTRGPIAAVGGGAALVVLAGTLLALTEWPLLATLGAVAGFAAAVGLLPLLCLVLAIDYWRSAYSRMGYFTHSLPVRGSTIYGVRLLYGLAVSAVGTAVTAVLLLPLALVAAADRSSAETNPLVHIVTAAREGLAGVSPFVVTVLVALVVLWAWGSIVTLYFAASIGSGPRLAHLGAGGPIVAYVVLYVVLQVLPLLAIPLIPFGIEVTPAGFGLVALDFQGALNAGTDVDALPLGVPLVSALAGLVLIAWTARSWNRGVTLR